MRSSVSKQRSKVVWAFSVLVFLCLGLLCSVLHAEDISFDASVSSNKVSMGTGLTMTLTVHGTQDVNPPPISSFDGFDVQFVGPSTQVSVVNGAYSTAKSFTYTLLPLKEGKFTIPSFEVSLKGQMYRTQPIIVDVDPSGQAAASGGAGGSTLDLESRIKLLIMAPRTDCYVSEQFPLVIKLYVSDLPLQDISMPQITNDGLTVGDFEQPRQYEETLNGVKFKVVEFRTTLTPTRPGPLTTGPAVVTANLLFKVDEGRGERGGLFNDDFFRSFFGGYQKRPLTISSRAFQLNVRPLPEEGRPADFSGAVGQFDLQAEVAPTELKVGDPVTLKVAVFGSGDLKVIRMPQIKAEGFKVYDPQVKEENGRKVLEQVVIPTKTEVKELPALTFNYFDAQRGQYVTLSRGPFPLKVTAQAPGEEFQAVGYANGVNGGIKESLGRDLVFIKDSLGPLRDTQSVMSREVPFYAVLVSFLGLWGAAFVLYVYQRRLKTDNAFARRQRAPRAARAAWAEAEKAIADANVKKFYDALEYGLRAFFADVLSMPAGDALGPVLWDRLRAAGIPEDAITNLKALAERAELTRFASAASTREEMQQSLDEARRLVRIVEAKV